MCYLLIARIKQFFDDNTTKIQFISKLPTSYTEKYDDLKEHDQLLY